jgi:hypothetical protein
VAVVRVLITGLRTPLRTPLQTLGDQGFALDLTDHAALCFQTSQGSSSCTARTLPGLRSVHAALTQAIAVSAFAELRKQISAMLSALSGQARPSVGVFSGAALNKY